MLHKPAQQFITAYFSDNTHIGSMHIYGIVHQPAKPAAVDSDLASAVGKMQSVVVSAEVTALRSIGNNIDPEEPKIFGILR
jgi:hypothetical protein